MNSESLQQHELFFSAEPPGQAEQAIELLKRMDGLQVESGTQADSLRIRYSLLDYTLEGLEKALIEQGFRFDNGMLHQLGRTFAHYREDVQQHNLTTPEPKAKSREREIFVNIYGHHPHGDHDDTPEELREYK